MNTETPPMSDLVPGLRMDRLLTLDEVAELCNVRRRAVEDWIYRGVSPRGTQKRFKLVAINAPSRRVRPADLEEFIEFCTQAGAGGGASRQPAARVTNAKARPRVRRCPDSLKGTHEPARAAG